ncbi:MAG: RNA polymerase sigma factor [Candidatus Latescibacterota bacterium]|nr:MAG: RNA polymerase sigma factor [Candidatus Latescibacterota bacterium]
MLEDGEIIRRCQAGQTDLMDILVDRHKTELYTLCMRLTRNGTDADDLFQDTWVRAMKRLDSFSLKHGFKTWLFAICMNRYRDLYRWRRRWWRQMKRAGKQTHGEDDLTIIESQDPDPERLAISTEERVAVRIAVDKLEDSYRLPVLLHYFQGLSVAEIGVVLGIPQGTVKSRLHAGREKLRAALEGAGHGR